MEPPDERNAIEYGQLQSRLSVARTCVVAIEWSRSRCGVEPWKCIKFVIFSQSHRS